MDWKEKAVHLLNNSLSPVPTEHNKLDWESGNSCIWDDEERFAGRLNCTRLKICTTSSFLTLSMVALGKFNGQPRRKIV